jgi:hypothetical protein
LNILAVLVTQLLLGLVGGSVPVFDEIIMSTSLMNKIISVDNWSGKEKSLQIKSILTLILFSFIFRSDCGRGWLCFGNFARTSSQTGFVHAFGPWG